MKIDVFSNTHGESWIAVVGQLRKDHGRLPLPYVDAVTAAGGRARVISTFHLLSGEEIPPGLEVVSGIGEHDVSQLQGASGLVLPGGGDIDPAWFGCDLHPRTSRISHRRDRFELNLIRAALDRDLPILGICHGMQLLNVYFGGTLDQHLADDPTYVNHDAGQPSPKPVHRLEVHPRSELARVFGAVDLGVNSHHHQGVARLADGLDPVAHAEDGVLEAFVAPGYSWVVGVQWHPESMTATDELQARLFRAFVAEAAAYSTRDERASA